MITDMYIKEYSTINIPIPGVVPILKEISKRVPLVINPNGLPDAQYQKIKAIGLGDVFSSIVLSEELGIRKPDSGIFHHTASLLEVQPSDCLYVGDSYRNDIVGAKAAGMQACWFNREIWKSGISGVQPDFTITDFNKLREILGLS